MGVLMAAGLASIIALGIATAVTSGVDGVSHMRNIALAEDVTGLVSGLMGDPDYCRVHFAGTLVGTALPAVIKPSVVFKDINPGGTLGSTNIISPGMKYQNVLEVTSITLNIDNTLGAGRYLGSVRIALKGNTGYNLNFNRSIPLQIATDPGGKITACSRASEVVHGTTQGAWSDTCTDFAAKGWPSKDACLKDGRWHLVFQNTSTGAITRGSLSEMEGFSSQGAIFRIQAPPGSYGFGANHELCQSFAVHGSDMVCIGGARTGVPDWTQKTIGSVSAAVWFSNGKLVIEAPNTHVYVGMDWYAKF